DGLRVDPCIPSTWDGYSVHREFRGCTIDIRVHNPHHVCKGVKRMVLNGEEMSGNLLPIHRLGHTNQVEVWLG
ncbi:MAG TPA: glycosyl hydrolase family 65 protein, partial [Anaerolineaceae bacterium]|nr:glycosyl hydrolase family 65 protein [Anaerolineaceae bacterium]HQF46977.1 glycosyl hydrolase family 65 protein [Anaerolineaceae bacterium]HQH36860.1 glycosyl hydrolase family 65 protein [Anaerolineaceae bacterium]